MKSPPRPPTLSPALPCPECADRRLHAKPGELKWQDRGVNRAGNQRGRCSTCNRFAQAVRRGTGRRLQARHPEEYEEPYREAEREQWTVLALDYLSVHPPIEEMLAIEQESWPALTQAQSAGLAGDQQ